MVVLAETSELEQFCGNKCHLSVVRMKLAHEGE